MTSGWWSVEGRWRVRIATVAVAVGSLAIALPSSVAAQGVKCSWPDGRPTSCDDAPRRPPPGGTWQPPPPAPPPPPTPGTRHPTYPNVIWDANHTFRPEEGYVWLTDPPAASGFKVRPMRSGTRHPRYPNVVFDGQGGFRPTDGWEWATQPPSASGFRVQRVPPGTPQPGNPDLVYGPNGESQFTWLWERIVDPSSPRGFRYRRIPPGPHPRYPNFVITPQGDLAPAEGYRVVHWSPSPPRAERVAAGTRHPRLPNVVFGGDGSLAPAEGFRWAAGGGPKDPRVERVPDGTPHPRYAGVVFTTEGKFRPAEGFTWAPNRVAGDFRVVLADGYRLAPDSDPKNPRAERVPAGTAHPRHPNVLFTANGHLVPAEGFRWAKDRGPGEYRVELKEGFRIAPGSDPHHPRVERVAAGTPHPRYPNVVFSETGALTPAEGYRWAPRRAGEEPRVERVPAGTPHPRLPNVTFGAAGTLEPRNGFRWADGAGPRDPRVERIPAGTPHPRHPNVVFAPGGGVLPADGYRWAQNRTRGEVGVEPVPPVEATVRHGMRRVLDAAGQLLSAAGDAQDTDGRADAGTIQRLRRTFDLGVMNPVGSLRAVTIGTPAPVAADAPPAERERHFDRRRDAISRERSTLEAQRERLQAQPRTGDNAVALSRVDNELSQLKSRERAYELLRGAQPPSPRPRAVVPPPSPGPVTKAVEAVKDTVKGVVYGEPIVKDADGDEARAPIVKDAERESTR